MVIEHVQESSMIEPFWNNTTIKTSWAKHYKSVILLILIIMLK